MSRGLRSGHGPREGSPRLQHYTGWRRSTRGAGTCDGARMEAISGSVPFVPCTAFRAKCGGVEMELNAPPVRDSGGADDVTQVKERSTPRS